MKEILITSILALTFSGLHAQTTESELPKLVVMLTIDQLRSDYLENFAPLYGEKGFKRLLREGRVYRHTELPYTGADRASAIATLHTGTTPSLHGIVAENWLDTRTLRPINCVDDEAFMGNYTDESSSASALLTSTSADELKISTCGKALVYSIAPFRDAAILAGGHSANGAFWLNENTGKWCSSTYYAEFPWWMSQYNDRWSPDFRIKDLMWTPLFAPTRYVYLPEWRSDGFKYSFSAEKQNKYRRLTTSPLVNDEVNLLAEELLNKSSIGKDQTPDLLALTYYAGNYNHRSVQECAMEMQDTYARLDQSLSRLLELLEQKVGLKNVLLCLASTGYSDPESPDTGLYRIPGGEFHLKRCATLLNMYLMATYGTGQYVEGYYDRQIYLNHKLIESKQLDLTEIQEKSAAFAVQFSGVNEVYSAHDLLLGPWSPRKELRRASYHRQRSGDLVIEVLPGWTVIQEHTTDHRVVRASAVLPTPLILLGAGFPAQTIQTPVRADRLAPTLTGALHIRAPNACSALPLD